MLDLSKIEGFEWDKGNNKKNWKKHKITNKECEETFSSVPIYFFYDSKHSDFEPRTGMFGKTREGKLLAIVFTIRNNKIRIITARPQSKKEKLFYIRYEEKNHKKNTEI